MASIDKKTVCYTFT